MIILIIAYMYIINVIMLLLLLDTTINLQQKLNFKIFYLFYYFFNKYTIINMHY